ncbi:MAG: hypothetical protein ACRC7D_10675 [Aeromonas popoffii]|uniref:hypothetical protein n=1 Tax=Aeromonas popoffii TaxID=70856 RepID=UPI003F2AFB18
MKFATVQPVAEGLLLIAFRGRPHSRTNSVPGFRSMLSIANVIGLRACTAYPISRSDFLGTVISEEVVMAVILYKSMMISKRAKQIKYDVNLMRDLVL